MYIRDSLIEVKMLIDNNLLHTANVKINEIYDYYLSHPFTFTEEEENQMYLLIDVIATRL